MVAFSEIPFKIFLREETTHTVTLSYKLLLRFSFRRFHGTRKVVSNIFRLITMLFCLYTIPFLVKLQIKDESEQRSAEVRERSSGRMRSGRLLNKDAAIRTIYNRTRPRCATNDFVTGFHHDNWLANHSLLSMWNAHFGKRDTRYTVHTELNDLKILTH